MRGLIWSPWGSRGGRLPSSGTGAPAEERLGVATAVFVEETTEKGEAARQAAVGPRPGDEDELQLPADDDLRAPHAAPPRARTATGKGGRAT